MATDDRAGRIADAAIALHKRTNPHERLTTRHLEEIYRHVVKILNEGGEDEELIAKHALSRTLRRLGR